MHKYKKNEQKFIFRLVFSVFGLRRVAVASRFPRIARITTDNMDNKDNKKDQCKSVGM